MIVGNNDDRPADGRNAAVGAAAGTAAVAGGLLSLVWRAVKAIWWVIRLPFRVLAAIQGLVLLVVVGVPLLLWFSPSAREWAWGLVGESVQQSVAQGVQQGVQQGVHGLPGAGLVAKAKALLGKSQPAPAQPVVKPVPPQRPDTPQGRLDAAADGWLARDPRPLALSGAVTVESVTPSSLGGYEVVARGSVTDVSRPGSSAVWRFRFREDAATHAVAPMDAGPL